MVSVALLAESLDSMAEPLDSIAAPLLASAALLASLAASAALSASDFVSGAGATTTGGGGEGGGVTTVVAGFSQPTNVAATMAAASMDLFMSFPYSSWDQCKREIGWAARRTN